MRSTNDPIAGLKQKLLDWGVTSEEELKAIDKELTLLNQQQGEHHWYVQRGVRAANPKLLARIEANVLAAHARQRELETRLL